MKLLLSVAALIVLLWMLGHSLGAAIEHELRPVGLTAEQRLDVMSRITRPQLVVADAENLDAYDRMLTRQVEEIWRNK